MKTKNGLPKHCSWNEDRHGTSRVRFRRGARSIYLTGEPWSEDFMQQYANALGDNAQEYTRVMHRPGASGAWEHWQLTRDEPGSRWRRTQRTKCIDDMSNLETRLDKPGENG